MRTTRRLCSLPFPNYLARIGDGVRGLKIGIDRKYTQEGVDAEVVAALLEAERTLADLGAEIREVKFPSYEKLVSQLVPMCSVETAEAHLETYPSRKSEYGPDLAQLIEQGQIRKRCRDRSHSSRAAENLRQPGGIVWGRRPVADPDNADADSDAGKNE